VPGALGCGVGEEVCILSGSLEAVSLPLLFDMAERADSRRSSGGRLSGCVEFLSSFAEDLFDLDDDFRGDLEAGFDGDLVGDFADDLVGDFAPLVVEAEDFVGDRVGFRFVSCEWRSEDEPVVEVGDSVLPGLLSPLSGSGSRSLVLGKSLVLSDFGREEDLEKSLGKTITRNLCQS
jgi:hypothetical protein